MKIKPLNKVRVIILAMLMILFSCAVPILAEGTPGDSVDNPIIITTAAQLNDVRTNLGAFYKLGADISLSDYSADAGWEPIGTEENPFSGGFDGAGHTISGMNINRPAESDVGLFGRINQGYEGELREIKNLTVVIEGTVSGNVYVGGLVGFNGYYSIKNCTIIGAVSGIDQPDHDSNDVGGIVGYCAGGSVTNCNASGNVSGHNAVGGLIGIAHFSYVANCYKTVSGSGSNLDTVEGEGAVGGLVGGYYGWDFASFSNIFENSYSNCHVVGLDSVGGLVGLVREGYVQNCYSKGSVTGSSKVGGLAGAIHTESYVLKSYSNCAVTGVSYYGGLVGDNRNYSPFGPPTISSYAIDSFFSEGQRDNGLGEPLDATEMMTKSIFIDSGWDFTTIWDIIDGYYTPFLRVSAPTAGTLINDCMLIINQQNMKNSTAYTSLLLDAQKLINKGKFAAAKEDLLEFIAQVNSQSGKKINVAAATELISIANYLIGRIS